MYRDRLPQIMGAADAKRPHPFESVDSRAHGNPMMKSQQPGTRYDGQKAAALQVDASLLCPKPAEQTESRFLHSARFSQLLEKG